MLSSLLKSLLLLLTISVASGQTLADGDVDSTSAKQGGKALLYSFVPGGGQIYNHRFVKAAVFASIFAYYGYEYVKAEGEYEDAPLDQDLHRARNDKIWMMSLVWTLNIIDAYVDAQLWDFDKYEIDQEGIPPESDDEQNNMNGTIDDTD